MSEKVQNLIEEVKALTVLELSELVKALEEEFGVSFREPVHFVTVQDVLDFLEKNATKR